MPSDIGICNIALMRVAHTQPIASLGERSKAAELCTVLYGPMRELVLKAFPWPFAESVVALASIGTPQPGWAYRYRYPANCLQVRQIMIPGQRRALSSDQQIPFQIGFDVGGRVIHTDQPDAQVSFTYNVDDPTFFDALFADALAFRLGMELALPLSSKPDLQQYCQRGYAEALTLAEGAAFEESQDDPEPDSEFVSVRR